MGTVVVLGLGYVGLPLAVQAAEKGLTVIGIDYNAKLVEQINARESPYTDDARFTKALVSLHKNALQATTSPQCLQKASATVICVPTPTDNGKPDLTYVTTATNQVAKFLRPGQLILLESTVNPGVTREVVLPILEEVSGLKVGQDFNLAHCPERIDPGNKQFFVGNLNRVVGGITAVCTKRATAFYANIIDAKVTPMQSAEEAEFVKSWENSHRNVMIALANSAAAICDALGMDIDRILDGLQSKVDQFELTLARPGIGPGGHCIPEDIHYVINKARQSGIDTRFLDDAADLNDKMPQYAVHRLAEMVKDAGEDIGHLHVALLGLAYKPNVADLRRSPSIEAGHYLARHAKSVTAHDPLVSQHKDKLQFGRQAIDLEDALAGADAVFIGTAHELYKEALTADLLTRHNIRFVLDGRNMLDKKAILAAGIHYRGIGK